MSSADPLLLRLLARLPLRCWRVLAYPLAALLWLLAPKRRHVARRNLELCFPTATPAQRRRWLWQTFLTLVQSLLDRIWVWHGTPQQVRERVQIDDPHGVLQRSGPLLCFAPHFPGIDAGWARLTLEMPERWLTVYSPQTKPWLERWVNRGRLRYGKPTLVSRREGVRPVARGLRQGGFLVVLTDMDLGPAEFVPFFGIPAATVAALARYAELGPAPVVCLVGWSTANGYRVEVSPLWSDFPSGDAAVDARRMNAELERYILRDPGQYHWLHRRFKTRPPGAAGVYGG